MAKMAGNCRNRQKWLEIKKWLKMAGMSGNDWKWLKIAENG